MTVSVSSLSATLHSRDAVTIRYMLGVGSSIAVLLLYRFTVPTVITYGFI